MGCHKENRSINNRSKMEWAKNRENKINVILRIPECPK